MMIFDALFGLRSIIGCICLIFSIIVPLSIQIYYRVFWDPEISENTHILSDFFVNKFLIDKFNWVSIISFLGFFILGVKAFQKEGEKRMRYDL